MDDSIKGTLSFLDQCSVVCLKYIASYSSYLIQSGEAEDIDNVRKLCKAALRDAAEFGDDQELQPFTDTANCLVCATKAASFDALRLQECLNTLQSFLEQDAFDECAEVFVRFPVNSVSKISLLLFLIYKTSEVHGHSELGTVIDIGTRYMRKNIDFVEQDGGWISLGQEYMCSHQGQGDVSASIVVVSYEGIEAMKKTCAGDASNEGTGYMDDDRDSLATPPELVEKPLLAESYIQEMGAEQLKHMSSGNGDDFELVDSVNAFTSRAETMQNLADGSKSLACLQKETHLDVLNQKFDLPETKVGILKRTAGVCRPDHHPLGGYLPHLSIGVAAVAAIAGFFVLKKNM